MAKKVGVPVLNGASDLWVFVSESLSFFEMQLQHLYQSTSSFVTLIVAVSLQTFCTTLCGLIPPNL